MGLAASHARLCMLTLRKSDVEGRLMHIANKKLSLARDSERISEEYNNGLNATLLTYNTGASDVPVTYNLLMSPTTQCMLTNANGAVVLDDSFCAALGITGGKAFGDKSQITTSALDFVNAKANTAYSDISQITGLSGASSASTPGTQAPADTQTVSTSYNVKDVFKSLIGKSPDADFWGKPITYSPDGSASGGQPVCIWQGDVKEIDNKGEILTYLSPTLDKIIDQASTAVQGTIKNNLGTQSNSSITTALSNAVSIATKATENYYQNQAMTNIRVDNSDSVSSTELLAKGSNQIFDNGTGGSGDQKHEVVIDPNQVVLTFLSYFNAACSGALNKSNQDTYQMQMNTINMSRHAYSSDKTQNANQTTSSAVTPGSVQNVDLKVTNTSSSSSTKTVTPVSAAVYYYNLYQQICNGWARDNNVDNQDYLQGMVQHGNYGIKQYQNGKWVDLSTSSPDSPLNVTDDTDAQKKAEAKYDAEKDKINFKEKLLDVEQNSADTERQAVTTEIDSVKKLIDKNMDAFKLFQQG